MIGTRVIALGQEAAGDDGVGLAVLAALRQQPIPSGTELVEARDASALISLLETPANVVIIDAAVAAQPGQVIELPAGELADRSVHDLHPVSSHGLGIPQAIALVRQLSPSRISPSIRIVLITITRPVRYRAGLSSPITAIIDEAAARVLALAAH
jgi:hydrogenase maturation protease